MDWATAFEMLSSLGGAAMQQREQRQAQSRQAAAIAAAQAEQDALARRRQAMVMEQAQRMAVPQTEQQLAQVIQPQQQRLEGVAREAASAQVARPAGASPTYDTEMAKRAADELQRAIAEAGMAARAGGGQRLMFEQGLQGANAASGMDDITSIMRNAARASDRGITNAGRVNAGTMVGGSLLQAASPQIGRAASRVTGLNGSIWGR